MPFFLIFIIFSLSHNLLAQDEYYHAFQDQANPLRILLLRHENFTAQLYHIETTQRQETSYSFNEYCISEKAKYVHPFLVTPQKLCVLHNDLFTPIDEKSDEEFYDLTYLAQTQQEILFLYSQREMGPSHQFGKIKLLKINKEEKSFSHHELVLRVPGFSGPLIVDRLRQRLVYTLAQGTSSSDLNQNRNIFFFYNLDALMSAINSHQTLDFLNDFERGTQIFTGLSGKAYTNGSSILFNNRYENTDYQSYIIDLSTFSRRDINLPANCEQLGSTQERWLFLCQHKFIRSYHL